MAQNEFLKSDLVSQKGELGTATLVPPKGGGGGGDVTAKAVMEAIVDMTDAQAETTREALGAEDAAGVVALIASELAGYSQNPTTTAITGSTPTIAASDNTIYECGECTSLTVSSFPASGKFWIWFTSGSTATTVTGIDNFTPEANKKYRVFVENGYATFDAWTVGGGS